MDGGRILLGDNSADGAIVLWPITLQCDEAEIQLDSLLYRHTHRHVFNHMDTQLRLALDLPEHDYYISRGVCVLCTVVVNTPS